MSSKLLSFPVSIAFGVDERFNVLPIIGLPPGVLSIRRRIRAKRAMVVFVRMASGISQHYFEVGKDHLQLYSTIGINRSN